MPEELNATGGNSRDRAPNSIDSSRFRVCSGLQVQPAVVELGACLS